VIDASGGGKEANVMEENAQTNPSPGWMLQMVDVPTPGKPLMVFTVVDIGSLSLLSAEWVQGLDANVNTLMTLAATHGFPRILICNEIIKFRCTDLRNWAAAHKIVLQFKEMSGENRDFPLDPLKGQKAPSLGNVGERTRVEFRSIEQADYYLNLLQEILKRHVAPPGGANRTRLGGDRRQSRSVHAGVSNTLSTPNIRKLAKQWVHHSSEIVEPAFIRSFDGGIDIAAESGFTCHSSPMVLAGLALDEVRKVEESIARIRFTAR
jgi:hypothetical protein